MNKQFLEGNSMRKKEISSSKTKEGNVFLCFFWGGGGDLKIPGNQKKAS